MKSPISAAENDPKETLILLLFKESLSGSLHSSKELYADYLEALMTELVFKSSG